MNFLDNAKRRAFEENKPEALAADIRMISGCEDCQTSADVSNVNSFKLPDPAGRAGGACTSTLLQVLYKDNETPADEYSFIEVLDKMRQILDDESYTQKPQLTSSHPIDITHKFDLVPPSATGTRRALLVGINYVGQEGQLSGCHNDVGNMVNYIKNVHEFEDDNITVLLDDDEHEAPTKENMLAAYKKIVQESSKGDAIFLHYSGHGTKIRDDDRSEEDDGYDEALVPVDYDSNGLILDDDLYDIVVKGLPEGVHVVCLMDCCHSGTVLDLPYVFKPNGEFGDKMEIAKDFDFNKLAKKLGGSGIGMKIGSFLMEQYLKG